ncbi:uncharacterized protein Eint_080120 [Encephalitozoon intestinalis ATCC 50506]|uniref:Uncharacterized protein n=1 Tax=Encephalitozoon intestinalis (strain ATCC 50506) TaxID=876142 RepID=E0S8F5_ENCIT|nr:uncharacterized protein Eint_080120 [Encephalitozoon intestinalis ATCC 50506]ADM11949.2 hypothetical protein Eint_080120 [Encephalitozoon intestinalis ATCC 50506]UTX45732.1 checkpoint protein Hus1 [Encephalitozoon intestinalis]
MDCMISPQNAFTIDRILQAVRTSTILIDTTKEITFQLVSSDKTLVLNLDLKETFFETLSSKNRLALIPRQKFYIKKMKLLKITTKEYIITFEYVFDKYILRRRVFYNPSSFFSVGFKTDYSGEVSPSIMRLALKEISDQLVTLKIDNGRGEIYNEETKMGFPLEFSGEFSVDLVGGNLRSMLEVSDLFARTIVNYGASNPSINFIFLGNEIRASFFAAINHNPIKKENLSSGGAFGR